MRSFNEMESATNTKVTDLPRTKLSSPLLPVQEYRYQFAQFLKDHKSSSSLVIIGDTGSGKTTQIPQLLLNSVFDEYFGTSQRSIAVTQPRRVAAVSIAERVATELGSKLGTDIGYAVRFDSCYSPNSKVIYMTDGMLMRMATAEEKDSEGWLMKQFNMIIIDEVHERSLDTDILLALVRKVLNRRKKLAQDKPGQYHPLKVIVMSATVDVEAMKKHWSNAPLLYIPGRTFPVEIRFSSKPIEDYVFSSLVTVFQIHQHEDPGVILVFLTGSEEIEDFIRRAREIAKSLPESKKILFTPLYAALPADVQRAALSPVERARKVIVSTNVAETSLTIPGVKYVVDSGRVKRKQFVSGTGVEVLKVQNISQAQAWQRTGRAGREQPGVCYRLYTEDEFEQWPLHSVPEILRCNLSSVVLYLASMGLNEPLKFRFFDAPDEKNIRQAVDELVWLGAVEQTLEDNKPVLTLLDDGKLMVAFPLEPKYSRCLLRARIHNCMEEMIEVIAMLSTDSPFFSPPARRKEAENAHQKFTSNEGDYVSLLNVWRAYSTAKENLKWCRENYLNIQNLKTASKIRSQLKEIVLKLKIPISSCGKNTTAFRKAIAEGLFMNAAERQPDGTYVTLGSRQPVHLHPSSSLFKSKPSCVVFNELVQTSKAYIRILCLVDEKWLVAVGDKFYAACRMHGTSDATTKAPATPISEKVS